MRKLIVLTVFVAIGCGTSSAPQVEKGSAPQVEKGDKDTPKIAAPVPKIAAPDSKRTDKETRGTKKRYTEEEFRKLVLGSSRSEVRAALGAPDGISDNGNYWIYNDMVAGHSQVEVWFQKGVVDLLTSGGDRW